MTSNPKQEIICVACKEQFQFENQLKYHIRKHHFNRVGLVPYCETQSVNQVWVEKVVNTNVMVEMKKAGENVILIQKLPDDTSKKPTEMKQEKIDLRKKYPLLGAGYKRDTEQCRICQKAFGKRELSKHFATNHPDFVTKKCDTCKLRFDSLNKCAMHVCPGSVK